MTDNDPLAGVSMRLDAYYYSFSPTRVDVVDRILSAVACAGKSLHSTAGWSEPNAHLVREPFMRGSTCVEHIQNAAEDAAAALAARDERIAALEAARAILAAEDDAEEARFTLNGFHAVNAERARTAFSPTHGLMALVACVAEEVGELAGAVLGVTGEKKRKAHKTTADVLDAVADAMTYLSLVATEAGCNDLEGLLASTFNMVSERAGSSLRVPPARCPLHAPESDHALAARDERIAALESENASMRAGAMERIRELTARADALAVLVTDGGCDHRYRCTCGSGGHPRECKRHPNAFRHHVAELSAIGSVEAAEGEARLTEAIEEEAMLRERIAKLEAELADKDAAMVLAQNAADRRGERISGLKDIGLQQLVASVRARDRIAKLEAALREACDEMGHTAACERLMEAPDEQPCSCAHGRLRAIYDGEEDPT